MEYKLADKLKELRTNKGVTQKEISDYLSVDVTTYAHYEKGRRTPNADKLRMLSLYYGLTDELFDVHKGETENDINHSVELTKHYVDSLMKNLNISENDAINILDIPDDVKKRMLIYYMALYNSKRESQKENNNSKKKKI